MEDGKSVYRKGGKYPYRAYGKCPYREGRKSPCHLQTRADKFGRAVGSVSGRLPRAEQAGHRPAHFLGIHEQAYRARPGSLGQGAGQGESEGIQSS